MSDAQSVAPTTRPLTITDARRHLNLSTTVDDGYIDDCVDAATLHIEQLTQHALVSQTRLLKMQTFGDERYVHGRDIFLPRSPLSSVTSITYVDTSGTTQTLSSTAYRSSTGDVPGRVSEAYNNTWPATRNVQEDVTVTYVAGYGSTQSSVPANLRHAVRLIAGHYYRNRESVLIGSISKEVEFGVEALIEPQRIETYG